MGKEIPRVLRGGKGALPEWGPMKQKNLRAQGKISKWYWRTLAIGVGVFTVSPGYLRGWEGSSMGHRVSKGDLPSAGLAAKN